MSALRPRSRARVEPAPGFTLRSRRALSAILEPLRKQPFAGRFAALEAVPHDVLPGPVSLIYAPLYGAPQGRVIHRAEGRPASVHPHRIPFRSCGKPPVDIVKNLGMDVDHRDLLHTPFETPSIDLDKRSQLELDSRTIHGHSVFPNSSSRSTSSARKHVCANTPRSSPRKRSALIKTMILSLRGAERESSTTASSSSTSELSS